MLRINRGEWIIALIDRNYRSDANQLSSKLTPKKRNRVVAIKMCITYRIKPKLAEINSWYKPNSCERGVDGIFTSIYIDCQGG